MQEFVETYIKEQEEKLTAALTGAKSAVAEDKEQEKSARLIRLGMCRKEYNPAATYSADYPYQEYKSGKYYRLVPHAVSEEEYAAICRYDNAQDTLAPHTAADKVLGKKSKSLRAIALFSFFFGIVISVLGAVLLYLEDTAYLGFAAAIAVGGSLVSWLSAIHFFTTAKILEKTDYLLAKQFEKDMK